MAIVFGIVFVVFAGLAALVSYDLNKVLYTSAAPASLFEYYILTAMLPFLAVAVISFFVAALIPRTMETKAGEEAKTQKTEAKPEQETETQPEQETQEIEDFFKETPT